MAFALSAVVLTAGGLAAGAVTPLLQGSGEQRAAFERNMDVAGFPWLPGPGELHTSSIPPSLPTASEATPAATASQPVASDERMTAVRRLLAGRPLAGYAELMISVADEHGIDWRLLPVIAYVESGGGVNACSWNAWGYAGCRAGFGSFDEGIRVVAALLASPPYAGLSTAGLLCMWVSGSGCNSQQAVDYAYRAAGVYSMLGGWFALPARIAAPQDDSAVSASDGVVAAFTPPPETASAAPTASPAATHAATTTTAPSATATPVPKTTPAPSPEAFEPTASATSSPASAATAVPSARPEPTAKN